MLLNAKVVAGGHVTPRWFRRGHDFLTVHAAVVWARSAFSPACRVIIIDEETGDIVRTVEPKGYRGGYGV